MKAKLLALVTAVSCGGVLAGCAPVPADPAASGQWRVGTAHEIAGVSGTVMSLARLGDRDLVLSRPDETGAGGMWLLRGDEQRKLVDLAATAGTDSVQRAAAWTLGSFTDSEVLVSAGDRFGTLSDPGTPVEEYRGVLTGQGSLPPVTGACVTDRVAVLASGTSALSIRELGAGGVLAGRELASVVVTGTAGEVIGGAPEISAGPGERPPVLPGAAERVPVAGLRSLTCLSPEQAAGLGVSELSTGRNSDSPGLVLAVVDSQLQQEFSDSGGLAGGNGADEVIAVDTATGMIVGGWSVSGADPVSVWLAPDGGSGVLVDTQGRLWDWSVN